MEPSSSNLSPRLMIWAWANTSGKASTTVMRCLAASYSLSPFSKNPVLPVCRVPGQQGGCSWRYIAVGRQPKPGWSRRCKWCWWRAEKEALWGLRWMQDAVQNSGKSKPGFYPVIGLRGAAGNLGRKRFVNNVARWSIGENRLHQRKKKKNAFSVHARAKYENQSWMRPFKTEHLIYLLVHLCCY